MNYLPHNSVRTKAVSPVKCYTIQALNFRDFLAVQFLNYHQAKQMKQL